MYSIHSTATNGEAGDSGGDEGFVFRNNSRVARGQEEKGGEGSEDSSLFDFTRATRAVVKTVGTDRFGVGSVGSHEAESELRVRPAQGQQCSQQA